MTKHKLLKYTILVSFQFLIIGCNSITPVTFTPEEVKEKCDRWKNVLESREKRYDSQYKRSLETTGSTINKNNLGTAVTEAQKMADISGEITSAKSSLTFWCNEIKAGQEYYLYDDKIYLNRKDAEQAKEG
ncbi:hypothetical protein ACN4EE_13620 [Geminocystis sp. CENA526]|uniref:hypothetical protein n=1 Tax=Geminocystis sp. CENA526 TaxID=1355871 RepID=UPI003D6F8320